MSKYPRIEFDRLKMYFGEPYIIDCQDTIGTITVYQPTIGDLVDIGYDKFYSTLNVFVTNTTANRLFLWEAELDWNEISDFQLFCLLYKSIDPDASKLLFGDLDWTSFEVFFKEDGENQKMVLASPKENIEIDENVYEHIHQYLQCVFNMKFEDEFTNDKLLKKWWIDKDRRQRKRQEKKKDEEKQTYPLVTLLSAFVCHPGTKYKLKELKEVGVCEFYDTIQRLQIYENTTALLRGLYSGMIDGSKIKPEEYNFMKEI